MFLVDSEPQRKEKRKKLNNIRRRPQSRSTNPRGRLFFYINPKYAILVFMSYDFTKFKKSLIGVEEWIKKVRSDILNMGDRFVPRHEFDSFLMRFHRLEQKVDDKIAK